MVVPAMQLASKIPDMSVQLWSSALLKGTAATKPKLTVRSMFPFIFILGTANISSKYV